MSFPSSVPLLGNWQFWYNSVPLGEGTVYPIQKVDGISLPAVRSADPDRPRDTGQFIGLDLLSGRDVVMDVWVITDGTSLQSAVNTLAAGLIPGGTTELPLWFNLPNVSGSPRYINARVRKFVYPIDLDYGAASIAKCSILWHATDPRIYSTPVNTVTVGLPAPLGGLNFNVTFPAAFGGGGSGSLIQADNTGNIETRPLITITGPCINPSITNQTTNQSLTFGITLAASDTLVIDTDLHSVVLNGTASRRSTLSAGSSWWTLAPGTSTVQFITGDGVQVAATCTLEWASAYLM